MPERGLMSIYGGEAVHLSRTNITCGGLSPLASNSHLAALS
jgi:hypothetical protein